MKKIKQVSESLAYHYWKVLNKDSQFAQMVMMSDLLKEEDFSSVLKLRAKLKTLLENCVNPPVSASAAKVKTMLEHLQTSYDKAVVCFNPNALQSPFKPQEYEFDMKELDSSQIHTAPYPDMPSTPMYQRIEDPNRFSRFSDANRRRGRPRKYPMSGMGREYLETDEMAGKGQDDNSMVECGVCGEPGDLICCEVCPSVYHLQCLELDQVPKGRWMCFFCQVVKDGFGEALKEKSVFSEPVSKLLTAVDGWQGQAIQLLDLVSLHPCARDMKVSTPKPDFPPEDLTSLRSFLINGEEYTSLDAVDEHIRRIWRHMLRENKQNSTVYSQTCSMQTYYDKVVGELQEMFGYALGSDSIQAQKSDSDPSKTPKIG